MDTGFFRVQIGNRFRVGMSGNKLGFLVGLAGTEADFSGNDIGRSAPLFPSGKIFALGVLFSVRMRPRICTGLYSLDIANHPFFAKGICSIDTPQNFLG